eukprot:403353681
MEQQSVQNIVNDSSQTQIVIQEQKQVDFQRKIVIRPHAEKQRLNNSNEVTSQQSLNNSIGSNSLRNPTGASQTVMQLQLQNQQHIRSQSSNSGQARLLRIDTPQKQQEEGISQLQTTTTSGHTKTIRSIVATTPQNNMTQGVNQNQRVMSENQRESGFTEDVSKLYKGTKSYLYKTFTGNKSQRSNGNGDQQTPVSDNISQFSGKYQTKNTNTGDIEEVFIETHEDMQRILQERDSIINSLYDKLRIYESTDCNQAQFNQKSKETLSNLKKIMQAKINDQKKDMEQLKYQLDMKNVQIQELEADLNLLKNQRLQQMNQPDLKDQYISTLEQQRVELEQKIRDQHQSLQQLSHLQTDLKPQYQALSIRYQESQRQLDDMKQLQMHLIDQQKYHQLLSYNLLKKLGEIDLQSSSTKDLQLQIETIKNLIKNESEEAQQNFQTLETDNDSLIADQNMLNSHRSTMANQHQFQQQQQLSSRNASFVGNDLQQNNPSVDHNTYTQNQQVTQLREIVEQSRVYIDQLELEIQSKDQQINGYQDKLNTLSEDKQILQKMLEKANEDISDGQINIRKMELDLESVCRENSILKYQNQSFIENQQFANSLVDNSEGQQFMQNKYSQSLLVPDTTGNMNKQSHRSMSLMSQRNFETPPAKSNLISFQQQKLGQEVESQGSDTFQKQNSIDQKIQLKDKESEDILRKQLRQDMLIFNTVIFSIILVLTFIIVVSFCSQSDCTFVGRYFSKIFEIIMPMRINNSNNNFYKSDGDLSSNNYKDDI